MDGVDQNLLMQAAYMQKQHQQLEKSIEDLDSQILDLSSYQDNLDFLNNSKGKESLSSLGKGVYMKTNIADEELFVEVGQGIVVKKSVNQLKQVISEQLQTLNSTRQSLKAQLEVLSGDFMQMISEIEKARQAKK